MVPQCTERGPATGCPSLATGFPRLAARPRWAKARRRSEQARPSRAAGWAAGRSRRRSCTRRRAAAHVAACSWIGRRIHCRADCSSRRVLLASRSATRSSSTVRRSGAGTQTSRLAPRFRCSHALEPPVGAARGVSAAARGDLQGALQDYDKALSMGGASQFKAHLSRALLLDRAGEHDEAGARPRGRTPG